MPPRPLLPLLLAAALVAPALPADAQTRPRRPAPARPAAAPSPAQVLNPAVRTGRLANGLTYYVLRNAEPRQRAEMYLALNAGSALEDQDQRGLAHMLEHMLFNGTERFPKGELVRYLESTGMRFGGDVNAYTSFDETVYTLTVPTDSARMYDRAFDVLRDWAGAALLAPDEVERERGVIIEEWRARDQNAGGRVRNRLVPELLPGSRYATRLPIGDTTVIRHAPPSALQRFYRDWYRPNLMALVVVGDVDVDATERRIREEFSTLRNPARPRVRPVPAAPRVVPGSRYLAVTDAELPTTSIEVLTQRPALAGRTAADERAALVRQLMAGALNQRLDDLRRSENAPFVRASVGGGALVRPAELFSATVGLDPDRVEEGYVALRTELERARQHGLTQGELDRMKARTLARYERAYAERERTPSFVLAQELVSHFLEGDVAQSADADLRLAQQLLPSITLAEVNAEARRALAPTSRLVAFVGTDRAGKDELTTETLRALDQRVTAQLARTRVEPYVDRPVADALMAQTPTPGTFANATVHQALGTTVLTLGNGVRVVVKPTTFRADEVSFTMTSPGGTSQVSDNDDYAASVAAGVAAQSGVGTFDRSALDRFLAGKTVRVSPYIGQTSEGFNGSARPQDLELAFQMLHLYVTAPRFDAGALAAFKTQTRTMLANMGATPVGALQDSLSRAVFGAHPRVRTNDETLAALDAVTLADVERVYAQRFADLSEATFTLVGNVDVPTVQRLAQTYLATLPTTPRVETFNAAALPLRRTDNVEVKVYKGAAPQSQVVLLYQGDAAPTQEARQRLDALSNVLSIRLREKIREELSGVYGIQVQGSLAERPRPGYQMLVFFVCDPQRVDELTAAVRAEIATIAADGPSVEEVTAAQEQQRRGRQTSLEQNGFWLSSLDDAFSWTTGKPDEILGTYEGLVDQISGARIREDAQTYLGANARTVRLVVFPESMRPSN